MRHVHPTQVAYLWERLIWTSLHVGWWALGLHTASHPMPLIPASFLGAAAVVRLYGHVLVMQPNLSSTTGSAVAVATGLAAFALGTDTAGSGRVPAGLNGIIGIKPTVRAWALGRALLQCHIPHATSYNRTQLGRFSTMGVVPACRSLDCVSIFCNSVADGVVVASILDGSTTDADHSWRPRDDTVLGRRLGSGGKFRFGVPQTSLLGFEGGPGGAVVDAGAWVGANCHSSHRTPLEQP